MNISYKILFGIVLFLFCFQLPINAASATPSATTTVTAKNNLDDLKVRLATKVAELRNVVTRAISGTVSSLSVSSLLIETTTKNYKVEYEDDVKVAQIINAKRTELSIDDIDKADPVTVFGAFDENLELLKAKYIFIESKKVFARFSGIITNIDREGFVITIQTDDGKTMTADIEKTTKAISWTQKDGIVKFGFSKINIGDTIHLTGSPDPKKETNVSAIRILDLGNLSGESTPVPTLSPASESTTSATPKPTPKPTVSP